MFNVLILEADLKGGDYNKKINHNSWCRLLRFSNKNLRSLLARLEHVLMLVVDYAGFGAAWTKGILAALMYIVIAVPWFTLPFLMGHPAPLSYICYALWLLLFFGSCILAAIIQYKRES